MPWVLLVYCHTADQPVVVAQTFEISGILLQMLRDYLQ